MVAPAARRRGALQVRQRPRLALPQVLQERPRRRHRGGPLRQPQPLHAGQAVLPAQRRGAALGPELRRRPPRGAGRRPLRPGLALGAHRDRRGVVGEQQLRHVQLGQLRPRLRGALELHHTEVARAEVQGGQPPGRPHLHQRGAVVVAPALQERRLQRRAGRDHPHDAPRHQAARGAGILQLIAERHPVSRPDQRGQVLLHVLHRHPRQRHAQPLPQRLAGQRDPQLAADQLRVGVEGLVEVAQPEEEDGVRVLRLDLKVLAADGGAQGGAPSLAPRRLHGSV